MEEFSCELIKCFAVRCKEKCIINYANFCLIWNVSEGELWILNGFIMIFPGKLLCLLLHLNFAQTVFVLLLVHSLMHVKAVRVEDHFHKFFEFSRKLCGILEYFKAKPQTDWRCYPMREIFSMLEWTFTLARCAVYSMFIASYFCRKTVSSAWSLRLKITAPQHTKFLLCFAITISLNNFLALCMKFICGTFFRS